MNQRIGFVLFATLYGGTAVADDLFALPTRSYTVDADASQIYVVVRKDTSTAASGLSHDHVMEAHGFTGEVSWNSGDSSACSFSVTVPVAELVNDEPNMRRTAGLPDDLNENNRRTVRENMLDEGQLDADNHPTISFRSTGCSHVSGDRYNVQGNFTLLGNSRAITVPMDINADSSRIGAEGSFSILGSDYGLEPYTALAGQLRNGDELSFSVRISATVD